MSEVESRKPPIRTPEQLEQVGALLREGRADELQPLLDSLHPADIAALLEGLPLEERIALWQMIGADADGEILLEVSDAVRESLIADMDDHEILAAVEPLDACRPKCCPSSWPASMRSSASSCSRRCRIRRIRSVR